MKTVVRLGLRGASDTQVLTEAEDYDVFVTTDKQIEHQQNPKRFKTPRFVLPTPSWPKLQKQVESVISGIKALSGTRGDLDSINVDE